MRKAKEAKRGSVWAKRSVEGCEKINDKRRCEMRCCRRCGVRKVDLDRSPSVVASKKGGGGEKVTRGRFADEAGVVAGKRRERNKKEVVVVCDVVKFVREPVVNTGKGQSS